MMAQKQFRNWRSTVGESKGVVEFFKLLRDVAGLCSAEELATIPGGDDLDGEGIMRWLDQKIAESEGGRG